MAFWIYVDVLTDGKIVSQVYKGEDAALLRSTAANCRKIAYGVTASQSLRALAAQLAEKEKTA